MKLYPGGKYLFKKLTRSNSVGLTRIAVKTIKTCTARLVHNKIQTKTIKNRN